MRKQTKAMRTVFVPSIRFFSAREIGGIPD